MKDFKFFRNDDPPLFEGMEIVNVFPLMYNPESFEPQRGVIFISDDGTHYRITINTDHPQWNELRQRYP